MVEIVLRRPLAQRGLFIDGGRLALGAGIEPARAQYHEPPRFGLAGTSALGATFQMFTKGVTYHRRSPALGGPPLFSTGTQEIPRNHHAMDFRRPFANASNASFSVPAL